MAKMAAETPVSQRAGKNFWYAVKNQEENHLANWGARREVLNYFYAKAIKREKDIKAEELENKQRKELQKPFKSPVVAPQNILHLAQSAEGLARSAIQCCQQLGEEKVSESHRKVLRKASIQCANAWMRVSETLNKQVKEFSK
jgi:hypothetical protein